MHRRMSSGQQEVRREQWSHATELRRQRTMDFRIRLSKRLLQRGLHGRLLAGGHEMQRRDRADVQRCWRWVDSRRCEFICSGSGQCAGSCVPGRRQCAGTVAQSCDAAGRWVNTDGMECKRPLGQGCTSGSDCTSGNCVDRVCCESSCTGICRSCLNSMTGRGNGQCQPVRAGVDPDQDCAEGDRESCGNDGQCDGAGACRKYGTSTVCAAARCSANGQSELSERRCDGNGTCSPAAMKGCGSGEECQGTRCVSICGELDQNCCDGLTCKGSLACLRTVSGAQTCQRCGSLQQRCCPSSPQCREGVCFGAGGSFRLAYLAAVSGRPAVREVPVQKARAALRLPDYLPASRPEGPGSGWMPVRAPAAVWPLLRELDVVDPEVELADLAVGARGGGDA